jgi:type I restriction enzyme M protein
MHLISKLRDTDKGGGRIGIILNGSPLFTGGAGSGESEIRHYILESDLLEAIVALPTDMFYDTGISTYVWVLTNKKAPERKGKVQLINGTDLCSKMRKLLGFKRKWMYVGGIRTITRCFGNFETAVAETLDKPEEAKMSDVSTYPFDTYSLLYNSRVNALTSFLRVQPKRSCCSLKWL